MAKSFIYLLIHQPHQEREHCHKRNTVSTNFSAQKPNGQTNKTIELFLSPRRATFDPNHTRHGDRGSPDTIPAPPKLLRIRGIVSPLEVAGNLEENPGDLQKRKSAKAQIFPRYDSAKNASATAIVIENNNGL